MVKSYILISTEGNQRTLIGIPRALGPVIRAFEDLLQTLGCTDLCWLRYIFKLNLLCLKTSTTYIYRTSYYNFTLICSVVVQESTRQVLLPAFPSDFWKVSPFCRFWIWTRPRDDKFCLIYSHDSFYTKLFKNIFSSALTCVRCSIFICPSQRIQ